MQESYMPTLQVRDLPDEIYKQLSYLADKEHRSLSQQTVVLLREGIVSKLGNQERRKRILEQGTGININGNSLPDPVNLIREDRDR